ncbi:MAG: hypothetical protein M0R73_10445 [Dehalococcoidia bacterium]|nr:hypothetical protein [Dehalococcoidia bacterium]
MVGGHTLPLKVDNTGFLLDRLGEDCHPLQYIRELTQNSIEAIARAGTPGEIVWDVEWNQFDETGVYKLCITDTGDGMAGPDMVHYINTLSASGGTQSFDKNYGVGAKIAAATRNHRGLVYLSWRDGAGSMIHLWREPNTGAYGLKQIKQDEDTYDHWGPVAEDVRPALIDQHGTMVVLLGQSDDANTVAAPAGVRTPSRWIARYLNTRYFRFPDGVVVRAREGWEHLRSDVDRNLLRRVNGQAEYLAAHSESSGQVQLTGAIAHWWVLKDEGAITQNSGITASSGHIAALYQDELYELQEARSGTARLQHFGVVLGAQRVVLYIAPQPSKEVRLTTNTARTHLLANSEPLPWADWAAEFRARLPAEITDLIARVAAQSKSPDHEKSIRERLKQISDLFRVSRYRTVPGGDRLADPATTSGSSGSAGTGGTGKSDGGSGAGEDGSPPDPPGGSSTREGDLHSLYLSKDGVPAKEAKPDPYPKALWVSVTDGTRTPGDIEDRAAKYLPEQNQLLINRDFRVFEDMIVRWELQYDGVPGSRDVIEDEVRQWFEQSLVETVIGVQALRSSKEWSLQSIDQALSAEALTSAVMQRYHVDVALRRALATRLGSNA